MGLVSLRGPTEIFLVPASAPQLVCVRVCYPVCGMVHIKPALVWSRYRNANPVPTSPFSDDLSTAPSGPVRIIYHAI